MRELEFLITKIVPILQRVICYNIFFCLYRVKIQDFQTFKNHIALCEREHGLPKITVFCLPAIGEPIRSLENGRQIEFVDQVYDAELDKSEFNSSILRFSYSSMKTPLTVYDYDMETGTSAQKKIQAVSLLLLLSCPCNCSEKY